MTTAGKNFTQRMILSALVFVALLASKGSVIAQGLMTRDSTYTLKSGLGSSVNTGSNPAKYKINVMNGLSIRSGGTANFLSAWNSMGTTGGTSPDPAAFRRGNLIPRELLFDAQHFTFGASYNYGLNNMWHSGGFGGASKNPGLSLHAGFSF